MWQWSMNGYLTRLLICLFSLGLTAAASADIGAVFSKGRTHFSIYGGTGYAFDDDYLVLGLSGSYYIANGLSIGLAAESWSGGEPGILKVTPTMSYVFYQAGNIKPYIGAFYRRTYIDNLPDLDSAGGRAGIMMSSGRNAYLGVGAVYESYLDCEETIYRSCDDIYPEVSLTFAF